ncbi:MAG: hypothetical protein K2I06_11365 [Ruminococcus sp.]|nr:hypothetical protein [Ruminococcus sp.]
MKNNDEKIFISSESVKNAQHGDSKRKKIKYNAEYISYVAHGDSAVVFITRDIVRSINTNGKWIDVIASSGGRQIFTDEGDAKYRWDFDWFIVELFPRKTKPDYSDAYSDEDKKYITWVTAKSDIAVWRSKGYKGVKFKVKPKLVNKNKGKTKKVERLWNKKFCRFVPEKWNNADCEYRKVEVPVNPDWQYYILSIERLKNK